MNSLKGAASELRQKGHSYNQISQRLNIPKSTLSYWFKNLNDSQKIKFLNISKAKVIWAKNITAYNKQRATLCRIKWLNTQKGSEKEVGKLSNRELCLIGAALYWAEGFKKTNWNVVFCNSDPHMIRLMLKFFKNICDVKKDKLRAQIQVHPNVSVKIATTYWANITRIPANQFSKPILQVSKSSKNKRGNTLPYGTLRLRVNDVHLINRIKGWIVGLGKSI